MKKFSVQKKNYLNLGGVGASSTNSDSRSETETRLTSSGLQLYEVLLANVVYVIHVESIVANLR